MQPILYQAHIDGMRAIAVLSVIIFHFNNNWLPGGFIGVDIFFVISGFLITSIMCKQHMHDEFSYINFYISRIKRILPALFIVIFSVLIVGYFLVTNIEYEYIYRSARSTWIFISNFFFMDQGDYFSPELHEMPLLHTWSLGVEEQFYFFWPILLTFLLSKGRVTAFSVTLFILTLSFCSAIILTPIPGWEKFSYFMLVTRLCELLSGATLALACFYYALPTKIQLSSAIKSSLSIFALLLLAYSFLFITQDSQFPGYNIIWPCLASVTLIFLGLLNGKKTPIISLLCNPMLVKIGLLSYSLYLWHWPILAFVRYITVNDSLNYTWSLIAILLTFSLSLLTYYFIETPCRKSTLNFKKTFLIYYLSPLIIIIVFIASFKQFTNKQTYTPYPRTLSDYIKKELCAKDFDLGCKIGNEKKYSTIIIGDSHAEKLIPIFDTFGKRDNWSAKAYTLHGCQTLLGIDFKTLNNKNNKIKDRCIRLHHRINNQLRSTRNIIIINRWDDHPILNGTLGEISSFEKGLKSLSNTGKKIILVSMVPTYKKPVYRYLNSRWAIGGNPRLESYNNYNNKIKKIAKNNDNIYYFDITDKAESFIGGSYEGKAMYYDNNHLNYIGAKTLTNLLLKSEKPMKLKMVLEK